MGAFQWTPTLETRNVKIDADHKKIISKAQELSEAMSRGDGPDVILDMVKFLNAYVRQHFEEEEALQRKSQFPQYLDHKKNHDYFINELKLLTDKIIASPQSTVNVIAMNQLITGWFFNHIKIMDVALAKHLTQ